MRNIFSKELRQEVWYTIKTNKRRTFFTSLGVFAGMFFFTLLTGLGNGIRHGIDHAMEGISYDISLVMPGRTTHPYKGYKANRLIETTYEDYVYLRERLTTVSALEGASPWSGNWSDPQVILNGKSLGVNAMGISPHYFPDFVKNIVHYGRNLREDEIARGELVCVIGIEKAADFFGRGKESEAVGKILTIEGTPFRILGVIEAYSDNIALGFNVSYAVIMPLQAATHGKPKTFTILYYTPKWGIDKKEAEREILSILYRRHNIDPRDDKVFSIFGMDTFLNIFSMIERIINVLIWVIGLGTLFSGVISVSNILLVTVRERQREIGVRRAIGAKPDDIRTQFMMEAMFIILLAGMAGLVFGLLILLGVGSVLEATNNEMILQPYPSTGILIFSLIVMVLSGILAGLLPVYKALQIKAIDAIRDE